MHQMAAVSHHMFVSGRAQCHEKNPPPCVWASGGPLCTCKRKTVSGEQKRKKKGRCIPEQRHIPEQGKGGGMSQRNVGKMAHPKGWCEREGGGVVSQKGEGEARENDLERFVTSMASHKVNHGNFPKVPCHLLLPGYTSPTLLPQPALTIFNATQVKWVLFFFLIPPDCSPFPTSVQEPPLVQM